MTYEKGMFAFLTGTILIEKNSRAGRQHRRLHSEEITLTSVKLQGADKKEIEMKIGEQMRQEAAPGN